MKEVEICDGLKIVNVDGHELQSIKEKDDSFESGTKSILESLEWFAEDLEDKYEYEGKVPYEKLYFVLKQVISSGVSNQEVREAIVTGCLNETMTYKAREKKAAEEKPKAKAKKVNNKYDINISALTLYAKTHGTEEIAKHFGFVNTKSCRAFLKNHNIKWVKSAGGCPYSVMPENPEVVIKVAKDMRLNELAKMFGVGKTTMLRYLQVNNIEYKRIDRYAKNSK